MKTDHCGLNVSSLSCDAGVYRDRVSVCVLCERTRRGELACEFVFRLLLCLLVFVLLCGYCVIDCARVHASLQAVVWVVLAVQMPLH